MKAVSSREGKDETISIRTDIYYEEQARQEEIYLEKREEDARMILEFEDLPSSPSDESLDQEQAEAAEELVTGDADDPPLNESFVEQMLSDH
jgi:hypothetical protein